MQDLTHREELRMLLLDAPESRVTAALAIVLSLALLITVLILVRRRALREELTPIWVALALAITVVGLRLDFLRWLTQMIGAWTPSSTLFFLGEIFLVGICLHYAVRLSRSSLQIRQLAQDLALLSARVDRIAGEEAFDDGRGEAAR